MHPFVGILYEQLLKFQHESHTWKTSLKDSVFLSVFLFLSSFALTSKILGWFLWLEHHFEQLFFYSCFSLFLAFSHPFYFAQNWNKRSLMTFKGRFHYGAVCGVQRETTFYFSRQEKRNANDIWSFRKKYKSLIFYSMKNYKLHICFDVTHFEDCMLENESEINYIVKWFKAHNLALIGKHILTCLFLPKTMLPTKYDPLAHFAIVQRRRLKNQWKMNDKWWFLVRVSGKVPNTRCTLSLTSSFFTGLKN